MIKAIWAYLGRPYPQLDMSWWKSALIACAVVFLLFVIFEPFGINSSLGYYKWIILGGLMLISALCVGLPRWVLPMLLGKEIFEEKNWTVGKNIFYYILLLLLIATGNYLYICAFFTSTGFSFSMFLTITMNTFLIGIFPVGLMTILTENRNMSRHLKEVASMNACIRQEKPSMLSEPSALSAKIVLPDGIKETLALEPEEFRLAEADGNYVKIVYFRGGEIRQRSLRITMKQVEDAFGNSPSVQKCHRAFLVNLHGVTKVKGNSQGYRLLLEGWDEEIPVSRAYNKVIKGIIIRIYTPEC